MGNGQAYVGSAFSILKLFAANIWAMQQQRAKMSEQFYTRQKFIFYWSRNKYIAFLQVQSTGLINLFHMDLW